MRISESAKLKQIAKIRIADRVSAGAHFKSAYLDISARAKSEIPARLPGWAKEYLRGYLEAKLEALWRQVEFRYQLADGTWINAHDLEYSGGDSECRTPETCEHSGHYVAYHNPPAAHFWKGTDRPFTDPQPITDPAAWAEKHPPKGWASVEA